MLLQRLEPDMKESLAELTHSRIALLNGGAMSRSGEPTHSGSMHIADGSVRRAELVRHFSGSCLTSPACRFGARVAHGRTGRYQCGRAVDGVSGLPDE